jgi:hypothetical protein
MSGDDAAIQNLDQVIYIDDIYFCVFIEICKFF